MVSSQILFFSKKSWQIQYGSISHAYLIMFINIFFKTSFPNIHTRGMLSSNTCVEILLVHASSVQMWCSQSAKINNNLFVLLQRQAQKQNSRSEYTQHKPKQPTLSI